MADKADLETWGCVIGLFVIAYMGYWGYTALDSAGWISHREDSVITAKENWFVGESKDCTSYPLDPNSAKSVRKPRGYAILRLSCDDGPEHNVPITFWGRSEQPEYEWVTWRCKREPDSFTCKQTGNSEASMTGTDRATGRPVVSHDGGKTWQWADQ